MSRDEVGGCIGERGGETVLRTRWTFDLIFSTYRLDIFGHTYDIPRRFGVIENGPREVGFVLLCDLRSGLSGDLVHRDAQFAMQMS